MYQKKNRYHIVICFEEPTHVHPKRILLKAKSKAMIQKIP